MPVLESTKELWKSGLITTLLVVIVMIALLVNLFFLFVFFRSKKLRQPTNLFVVNICLVDLITGVLWALPTVVSSAEWKWRFGKAYCQFHGFIGLFGFAMNMYTLGAIAFEKFLKIWYPSRHSDAFHNYVITNLVLAGIWALSFVVAFMPLVGWGTFKYFDYQMQCTPDFVERTSLLNFFFINAFCFPFIWMLVFYLLTFVRIRMLQKKHKNENGKIIMESKKGEPGESFAAKLRRQQDRFKFNKQNDDDVTTGNSGKKEDDNGKVYVSDGSDNEAYQSDENEIYHDYEEYRVRKREREQARRRKKIYAYRQRYLFMAITMSVVTIIYTALWLPFFVVTFTWVYEPKDMKESPYTFAVFLAYCGIFYKPFIYLFNKHIRLSVKQAFRRSKSKTKKEVTPDYISKYGAVTEAGKTVASRPNTGGARAQSAAAQSNDLTLDDFQEAEL